MGNKYFEASRFLSNLKEDAITDSDREFCDKVAYAIEKSEASDIIKQVGDLLICIRTILQSNLLSKTSMAITVINDYLKNIEENGAIQ